MEALPTIPSCVGFILDGNRRWAKERGLPTMEGHRRGYEVLQESFSWVRDAKIPHVVCYGFSSENWNRSQEEVAYLMRLFESGLEKLQAEREKSTDRINIRFIGDRSRLSPTLIGRMEVIESLAHRDPELTAWIALSYGGRMEILDAVNHAVRVGTEVTEEEFSKLLWSAGMPDPDLIIRTSGEQRLSNFLPWQSVYSELFFTETYWPDFNKAEFQSIVEAYGTRKRRKGI